MASGNDGDPQWAQRRRGSHRQELSSERCVAEEADEVFRSYALCCYRQEREERGAVIPHNPEIEQIQQDWRSTASQVGQRLASIAEDVYRRYGPEFSAMIKDMELNPDNAYKCFIEAASSLFKDGINWSRVVVLLAFGYRMVRYLWQSGFGCFLCRIAGYIGEFLLQNSIAHWILQQGGWVVLLKGTMYGLILAGLVTVAQPVMRRLLA